MILEFVGTAVMFVLILVVGLVVQVRTVRPTDKVEKKVQEASKEVVDKLKAASGEHRTVKGRLR